MRSTQAWVREAFTRIERSVNETGRLDLRANAEVRQATVHVTQEGAEIVRQAYLLAAAAESRP